MFINRLLLRFIKGNEKNVLFTCFLDLLFVLLGTAISFLCAIAVRILFGAEQILFFTHFCQPFLFILVGLVLQFILSKKKTLKATECSVEIKGNLRKKLIHKLFELGPAFTAHSRTGDIADTISNKVEWLNYYYTLYLPTVVSAVVNAVVLAGVLFWLDWPTALVCLAGCGGMLGCPMVFFHLMRERGEEEWEAHASYYSDCLDSIQGMTALKAFNANRKQREYIHKKGEELRISVMKQLKITMLETGTLQFFARLGSAFSVAVAVVHTISIGGDPDKLIYILFAAGACFTPMMNLTNAWHMGYRGVTASYSIEKLLNCEEGLSLQVKENAIPSVSQNLSGDILFRNVNFSYNPEEGNVLQNVSFTIPYRTMTAFVGPSGGGKSTIAHLLAGFYGAQGGYIQIGSEKVTEENVREVQNMISAVWQDSHIFYGTVLDNIRMGRMDATEEEIVEAARKANIHAFIMSLPDGYHTLLGENGLRFSGGERQRIALARAFLKNSSILLFDEATSSLDRKNEMEIQESFAKLQEGKTSFVIAHRLATIQHADQICIVDRGRITEMGTHEELIMKSAAYRALMGEQVKRGRQA